MQIKLIAVGTRMPAWVQTAYQDYAKRLPKHLSLRLIEIPLNNKQKEGQDMLAALIPQDHVIALESTGQIWDSNELSQQLEKWLASGQDISFLIGGPEGLAPSCLEKAKQKWSLSKLTFPHPLVRIILAEQLYRAWAILSKHPYHK